MIETGGETKLLFFLPSATPEDKKTIRALVHKSYPGLLEEGSVPWSDLDFNRYRRGGGFTTEFAMKVIEKYNSSVDSFQLKNDNMESWPTNFDNITSALPPEQMAVSGSCEETVPEVPAKMAGDRELVYLPFPKKSWSPEMKRAFVSVAECMAKTPGKFIVSPWQHAENDADVPTSRWNLLLNQSMANLAVNVDPNKFQLRIILPKDISGVLHKASMDPESKADLRAVLLLRFHDDDGNQLDEERQAPGNSKDGFVPLFVFVYPEGETRKGATLQKRHEKFRLYNYRGDEVEWGDFSKRKTITYYELRDVMTHLASDNIHELWYMYRIYHNSAFLDHYVVGKVVVGPGCRDLNPVCIVWDDDNDTIKIEDKGASSKCAYEGSHQDFKRIGDEDLENQVMIAMEREDVLYNPDVYLSDIWAEPTDYEVDIDDNEPAPKRYQPPNAICKPGNFGIYGMVSGNRICTSHLNRAWRKWENKRMPNPLRVLSVAVRQAGEWVSSYDTFEYGGGGGKVRAVTIFIVGMGITIASAVIQGFV